MIPIDETKPDIREIDGVKYSFLPLLGEAELLYYRIIKMTGPKELPKLIVEAKTQIDSENPDKQWAKGERETAVRERASKMAESDEGQESIYDNMEAIAILDQLIDSVLVGWVSTTKPVRPFPEHKHPSRCFQTRDKVEIYHIIGGLNSIEESERKN